MIDQQQAQYGRGDPINDCGNCQYFAGQGKCLQVAGDISPLGVCRLFKPVPNPFGSTMTKQEIQAIKAIAANAAQRAAVHGTGGPTTHAPGAPPPPPQRPPVPVGPRMGSLAAPMGVGGGMR